MTQETQPDITDAAHDLDQLRRACRAHGLAAEEIVALPQLGISNVLYLVDGRHCLRLPGPMGWAKWSIHIEATGVPLAAAAGVSTPRLVASDLSGELVDAPFLIYEWRPGRPLSDLPTHDPAVRPVFVSLGRDLARLHAGELAASTLPDRPGLDPWELLERSASAGVLNLTNAAWFRAALTSLEAAGGAWAEPKVMVHGDVHPANVLMSEQPGDDDAYHYRALLDWGDLSRGDPRSDLVDVPLRAVNAVLAGYQQEAGVDLDSWRAAVLWSHLDGALRYLTNAPSHVPHWGFPPGGRVFEVIAFYSSGEADGWPRLPGPD